MEWIETTAPTVEGAKDDLLDQLGIDETEADFEVLEEPKIGLFGKVRQPARVRARIAPLAPRGAPERRRRTKAKAKPDTQVAPAVDADEPADLDDHDAPARSEPRPRTGGGRQRGGGSSDRPARSNSEAPAREPAPIAEVRAELESFLTGLVAACSLDGTVSSEVEEDGRLRLAIDGTDLGMLIGPGGGMLSVLQDLCRTRLHRCFPEAEYPKISVDAGGYRALRMEALAEHVNEVASKVKESGEAHSLGVMSSGDRKAVHDLIGDIDGVASVSEGEDPDRRVVIVASP